MGIGILLQMVARGMQLRTLPVRKCLILFRKLSFHREVRWQEDCTLIDNPAHRCASSRGCVCVSAEFGNWLIGWFDATLCHCKQLTFDTLGTEFRRPQ